MRLLFFLGIFLTSCSLAAPQGGSYQAPKLKLPDPRPLVMKSVDFVIITKDNAIETLERLEKNGQGAVIFGLSGQDYKAMSVNISDITNFIILQNEIIKQYKLFYERSDDNKEEN